MSAIENMVRMVLNAMDLDVEQIKTDVMGRVVAFETNVETLNATLLSLNAQQRRNALMLESICEHLGLEVPAQIQPTATNGAAANVNDTGKTLPPPA